MYSETTRAIKVTVRPFYLDQHSSPAEDRYVWAYHVRIDNEGGETVQLRNRHWQITDANGRRQEVRDRSLGLLGRECQFGDAECAAQRGILGCHRV